MDKLRKLLARIGGEEEPENAAAHMERLQLATAVLLIEIMRADFVEYETESSAVERMLARHFGLDQASSEALADDARDEADRLVSLHEYTRLLHAELNEDEKAEIIEMLWEVAFADDDLDRYEEYLIRKIAELLYVPHKELVRLRHKVRARLSSQS